MQLPNKLYSYKNSTLALMPVILEEISRGTTNVIDLYYSVYKKLKDPSDFISVMNCLFAVNTIDFTEEGEVESCL